MPCPRLGSEKFTGLHEEAGQGQAASAAAAEQAAAAELQTKSLALI